MPKSRRMQDLIIIAVIVAGLFSAALLAGNARYYANSVALAEFLEVDIAETRVSNIDPTNYSLNPHLSFVLTFKSPVDVDGEAYLVFIRILVLLNQQSIIYATFQKEFSFEQEALDAGYDKNHTIRSDVLNDQDKEILFGAYNSTTWTWSLTLRYTYSVMSSDSPYRRTIGFSYEGVTLL
ncbi:MAG: hypothetical protein ACXABV_17215 [Candidatus Thorarchaeota archaeon]|jgi:hypothetical protein